MTNLIKLSEILTIDMHLFNSLLIQFNQLSTTESSKRISNSLIAFLKQEVKKLE